MSKIRCATTGQGLTVLPCNSGLTWWLPTVGKKKVKIFYGFLRHRKHLHVVPRQIFRSRGALNLTLIRFWQKKFPKKKCSSVGLRLSKDRSVIFFFHFVEIALWSWKIFKKKIIVQRRIVDDISRMFLKYCSIPTDSPQNLRKISGSTQ